MYDFIRSKTFREYYEKENIKLTDEEQAAIIFFDTEYLSDKCRLLTDIRNRTSNQKLIEEINMYINFVDESMTIMKNNDGFIYQLSLCYDRGIDENSPDGFYTSYESAIESVSDKDREDLLEFYIRKYKINSVKPLCDTIIHDKNGQIYTLFGVDFNNDVLAYLQSSKSILGKYRKIKHPFRTNNIVKYEDPLNGTIYGFVSNLPDDFYNEWINSELDELHESNVSFEEMNITVSLLYDDWVDYRVHPLYLELISGDEIPDHFINEYKRKITIFRVISR